MQTRTDLFHGFVRHNGDWHLASAPTFEGLASASPECRTPSYARNGGWSEIAEQLGTLNEDETYVTICQRCTAIVNRLTA